MQGIHRLAQIATAQALIQTGRVGKPVTEPNLTVLIDINPALGLRRAKSRHGTEERFEDFGESLQARMRQGFLTLAEEQPHRIHVIDGDRSIDDVAQDIFNLVQSFLA